MLTGCTDVLISWHCELSRILLVSSIPFLIEACSRRSQGRMRISSTGLVRLRELRERYVNQPLWQFVPSLHIPSGVLWPEVQNCHPLPAQLSHGPTRDQVRVAVLPSERGHHLWGDLSGHSTGQVVGCVQRTNDPLVPAVAARWYVAAVLAPYSLRCSDSLRA